MLRKLAVFTAIALAASAASSKADTYFIEAGYPQDTGSSIDVTLDGGFHITSGVITDSLDNPTGYTFNLDLSPAAGFSFFATPPVLNESGPVTGSYTVFGPGGEFSQGSASASVDGAVFIIPGLGEFPISFALTDLTLTSSSGDAIPFINSQAVTITQSNAGLDGGVFFSGGPFAPATAAVPLPKSASAGLALLASIGALHVMRRRRSSHLKTT